MFPEFWGVLPFFHPSFLSPGVLPGSNRQRKAVFLRVITCVKTRSSGFTRGWAVRKQAREIEARGDTFPTGEVKAPWRAEAGQWTDSQSLHLTAPVEAGDDTNPNQKAWWQDGKEEVKPPQC